MPTQTTPRTLSSGAKVQDAYWPMSLAGHNQLSVKHPNSVTDYLIQCTTAKPNQRLNLGLNMNPIVHLNHLRKNLVFLSSIIFYSNYSLSGILLIYFRHSLDYSNDFPNHLYHLIIYKINTLLDTI